MGKHETSVINAMEFLAKNSEWLPTHEDSESQTILVTGGSGLVGSAIKDVLTSTSGQYSIGRKEKWIFLSSENGNLEEPQTVQLLFDRYSPTVVLHLAACVGGLFANMEQNWTFLNRNLNMNINVLDLAEKYGIQKVVSALSTCIFPDATTYPIDETMIHNGPPHESNFGYSYAKRMIDIKNRAANQKFKSEGRNSVFTAFIPCNIFGPNDNFDLRNSHVIPGLIHKMYLANERKEPEYTICGTGKPLRQFIYSKDLAKLCIQLIRNYTDPEPIILAVDECDEVSIKDVAQLIASNFEHIKTIEPDPKFSDGQYKKTASNKKLRNIFPDFKFTTLEEAIKETVDWFVNQQNQPIGKIRGVQSNNL